MAQEDNNNTEQQSNANAGGAATPTPPVEPKPVVLQPGQVVVDQSVLAQVLENQAELERGRAEDAARVAGLEAMLEAGKGAEAQGADGKLRERKNFEPAFRTVRLRQYPMGGNEEKLGYVMGWTNRGAYQKVDRVSGPVPVMVDYVDIVFLDQERVDGKLIAESVPLLDLLNRGIQKHCKIIKVVKEPRKEPTGEEITITSWDPQHGLVTTGETIDGYVGFTDITYTVQIPGRAEPVEIDGKYVN